MLAPVFVTTGLSGCPMSATPVAAAGRLYITSREGTTAVVRAGQTFEVLSTNTLDDGFDASPAIVDGEIYLRGTRFLYCIAEN